MEYQIVHLKNKIPVLLKFIPEWKSFDFSFFWKIGAVNENLENGESGISHFMEHLHYAGTSSRPDSRIIAVDYVKLGTNIRSYTTKHYTSFQMKVSQIFQTEALDLLADIINNPLFREKDIEAERQIVSNELAAENDDLVACQEQNLYSYLYAKHPVLNPVLGNKISIQNFNCDLIKQFRSRKFRAENIVLTVVGNFTQNMIPQLDNYFGDIPGNDSRLVTYPVYKNEQTDIQGVFYPIDIVQLNCQIGFPAYSYLDKRYYVADILALILGGLITSRLYTKLRLVNNICYYIDTKMVSLHDIGHLQISANVQLDNFAKMCAILGQEIVTIKENKVSIIELQLVKKHLQGQLDLQRDRFISLAYQYAKEMLYINDLLSLDKILDLYQQVNAQDILEVAQDIFKANKINYTLFGPNVETNCLELSI